MKTKRKLKRWVWRVLFGLFIMLLAIGALWPKPIRKNDIETVVAEATIMIGVPNVIEPEPEPIVEVKTQPTEVVLDTFTGSMTGYGADCAGCSGVTSSGYDVRSTIWYTDGTYGTIRILAAPKNIPLYSVIRVSNVQGREPFYAIVLDRGSAIVGTLFDLLCESEYLADYHIGKQYGIQYEIVRRGK